MDKKTHLQISPLKIFNEFESQINNDQDDLEECILSMDYQSLLKALLAEAVRRVEDNAKDELKSNTSTPKDKEDTIKVFEIGFTSGKLFAIKILKEMAKENK